MAGKRARGEGTIYFRESKGLWVAEIVLPDGRKKTKYARLQRDVRAWLQEERQALKEGRIVVSDRITFGEYLEQYMRDVAAHSLRVKTLEGYESIVRLHLLPALGAYRLTALTPGAIQKFYSDEIAKGYSRRTVEFEHAIIHKALDQAMRWGIVPRNVADLVSPPRPDKRQPTVWTAEQVGVFLEHVRGKTYYPIYLVAVYGGLRLGEVLGLHYEDLDWPANAVHVRHAVQKIYKQGLVITGPKTKLSQRTVTLAAVVMEALRDHADKLNIRQGLMFATRSGRPISPRNLLRHFHDNAAAVGLPRIRFHDLRHTSATLLLTAGVHPKVVQERLGHSLIHTTMDIYSHVMPAMHREASDKIDELLKKTCTGEVREVRELEAENSENLTQK